MKVLPILFNTDMVRAILEGRKTVTRRPVKPRFRPEEIGWQVITEKHGGKYVRIEYIDEWENVTRYMKEPYLPGDILYVRETWKKGGTEYFYRADFESDYLDPCETLSGGYPGDCAYHPGCEGCMRGPTRIMWRPSIHMPKEAARLFLRVTGVQVERLQDITEAGAISEGCMKWGEYTEIEMSARSDFCNLWDSTINPDDLPRYGWEANPWVWVIAFERCEKPEGWCMNGT